MKCNVVLQYYPQARKIAVLKAVIQVTDLGLKRSKDLVDRLPSIIKSAIAREEAEKIKQHLEAAGAQVSIN